MARFRPVSSADRAAFVTNRTVGSTLLFTRHSGGATCQEREKNVIELVIAACLATGECKETKLTYDAGDMSLMTCIVAGQAEIARWQQLHPAWKVTRWHCGVRQLRGSI